MRRYEVRYKSTCITFGTQCVILLRLSTELGIFGGEGLQYRFQIEDYRTQDPSVWQGQFSACLIGSAVITLLLLMQLIFRLFGPPKFCDSPRMGNYIRWVRYTGVNWIKLARYRFSGRLLVNSAKNLRVPEESSLLSDRTFVLHLRA
jgi:hypothetical protein